MSLQSPPKLLASTPPEEEAPQAPSLSPQPAEPPPSAPVRIQRDQKHRALLETSTWLYGVYKKAHVNKQMAHMRFLADLATRRQIDPARGGDRLRVMYRYRDSLGDRAIDTNVLGSYTFQNAEQRDEMLSLATDLLKNSDYSLRNFKSEAKSQLAAHSRFLCSLPGKCDDITAGFTAPNGDRPKVCLCPCSHKSSRRQGPYSVPDFLSHLKRNARKDCWQHKISYMYLKNLFRNHHGPNLCHDAFTEPSRILFASSK